jgi:hypothetical protein
MRRQAGIGAVLLVCVGVVLGATVFRSDIAQATGLSQSVTVNNTPAQAVPVREQNLDGGNIKVHEQGTVSVRSAGEEVSVTREFTGSPICQGDIYTVPSGENLIVEYISSQAGLSGADGASGQIYSLAAGELNSFLPFVYAHQVGAPEAEDLFSASEAVHYQVPSGTTLKFTGVLTPTADSTSTQCTFVVALGGHLEP